MAKLKVKKYVNKNSKSKAFGKTYGRIKHLEILETRDLAKHIQKHGSIFTSDVVVGVLEKLSQCIEELLQEGYKVKLNGLGTFYLSAKTTGETDAEEFDASNIERVYIRFLADKSKDYDWNADSQTLRSKFTFTDTDTDGNSNAPASGDNNGGDDNGGGGDDNGGDDNGDDPVENRP
jgi:predicted histone-like DNA-binding protein